MKKNKIVLSLSLIGSVSLYGCGDDADQPSTPSVQSTSYSVKAIGGYLRNAQVWLDLNGNFKLDKGEPNEITGDGGEAVLSIPDSISPPEEYQLIVKSIKNKTIDEDTGPVKTDYLMSAPAGQRNVTPFSTLVNIKLATGSTTDIETATQEVANQLGIEKEHVLSDFIAGNHQKAAFAAKAIVASGQLPKTEEALAKHAEPGNNSFSEAISEVSRTVKEYITNEDFTSESLNNVTFDSTGAISTDSDSDGVADIDDAFPENKSEWIDTDQDGVGDNSDLFPNDSTESIDTDNDSVGDNADAFPQNALESTDSDNDGVGDNADAFPQNPSETTDTDNDGVGNNADAFPEDASEFLDTDNDGIGDNTDKFPEDSLETTDSDNDGVGDNTDEFPEDASETTDSDNDGVGDNVDAFPQNASETIDTDNDGVGDNADAFPEDASESLDTDTDGVGDNADPDIDGDGIPNDEDSDPITPNAALSKMAEFISNTPNFYFLWDEEDDNDNLEIIAEKFTPNGHITAPAEQFNIVNKAWSPRTESPDIILTEDGWMLTTLTYQIEINTNGDVIAYPTHSQTPELALTATTIDLTGQTVSQYTPYFSSSIDPSATFSRGAIKAAVTITSLIETYEIDDDAISFTGGESPYTNDENISISDNLSTIYVNQSAGPTAISNDLYAVNIGDNLSVQFIDGGTANYYNIDDGMDNTATLVATGPWEEITVNGKQILNFPLPSSIDRGRLDLGLDEGSQLIISSYDNALRMGAYFPKGNSYVNEDLTLNETAMQDLFNAIVISEGSIPYSALIGSWGNESVTFDFNNDYTYTMNQLISDDDADDSWSGTESGTFSYDPETGNITVLSITQDNNGRAGLSDYLNNANNIFKVTSYEANQSISIYYSDDDGSDNFTLFATAPSEPLDIPDIFNLEYVSGKTFYSVWFGEGDDVNTGETLQNVPVVIGVTFHSDGTVSGEGILNSLSTDEDETLHFAISEEGLLYIEEEQDEAIQGSLIVCGSTSDYIKTIYLIDGEFDNVDLFFFDKDKAIEYANSLTAPISPPNCPS